MDLKLIKQQVELGHFEHVRNSLERYQGLIIEKNCEENELPLLAMCTLINDPNVSYNLCSILIEKGYNASCCDTNGLCALTYAIIFERIRLVDLFLKTYDFCDLQTSLDCYKNTLFHYVYALNNFDIIESFLCFYSKQYNITEDLFAGLVNSSGLSVLHLFAYANIRDFRASTNSNPYANKEIGRFIAEKNQSFMRSSNPVFLSNYIKKFYNYRLTVKTIATYEKTFKYKKFNSSVLYKIRLFDRDLMPSKPESTLNKQSSMRISYDSPIAEDVKKYKGWKSQLAYIFKDYEAIYSSSYRIPVLIIDSASSISDQQSSRRSRSVEDIQAINSAFRVSSPTNFLTNEHKQIKSSSTNSTSSMSRLKALQKQSSNGKS